MKPRDFPPARPPQHSNNPVATVLATALPDGSARECVCGNDIAIGTPAALDERGFEFHPECVNLSPREAKAARKAGASAPQAHSVRRAAAEPVGDLGDQVAALMLAGRGHAAAASQDTTASFLAHCRSLGAQDPRTGLRRGQDLTDAVAERLLENRVGVL